MRRNRYHNPDSRVMGKTQQREKMSHRRFVKWFKDLPLAVKITSQNLPHKTGCFMGGNKLS